MLRFPGGPAGRLTGAALVVAAAAAAWQYRDALAHRAGALWTQEPEVSAAVADKAAVRLAGLGRDGVTRVSFRAPELQSLILYRWAGYLPEALAHPRIGLDAGRLTLEGRVPTARFGQIEELAEVVRFLPDTAALRAVASLTPLDSAHVALEIHELGAAGVPIPERLIPPILARFRAVAAPPVAPNALAIPLPSSIGGVHVRGDSLVIAARGGV